MNEGQRRTLLVKRHILADPISNSDRRERPYDSHEPEKLADDLKP